MTDPDALTAIEYFRAGFQLLVEVDKRAMPEADAVVETFVRHVKSYKPALVSSVLNPEPKQDDTIEYAANGKAGCP